MMAETSFPVHRHHVDIVADDIDHMGHVNNAVYLKWVQEAILAYWKNTASAEEASRHLWVALRHDITYRRPAFLSDTIDATVIADGVKGSRAFFHTLIKRGEEILVDVRSSWCCLDATTRKPVRVVAPEALRRSATA